MHKKFKKMKAKSPILIEIYIVLILNFQNFFNQNSIYILLTAYFVQNTQVPYFVHFRFLNLLTDRNNILLFCVG